MKTKDYILDFHLFEGEGGEGGDASTAGNESEQVQVVYGKAQEDSGHANQVGSGSGGEVEDLDAEFAAMIGKGGRYHDVYGKKVSETVQERFKNQTDLHGQIDSYNEALTPLFMRYGLQIGDIEGLNTAVANDNAFYQSAAEAEGLDVDQYKENLKLKADAERGRQIEENYKREQQKIDTFRRWESEAAELQQYFPNFDLGREIDENEAFGRYLDMGASVRDAFTLTHMDSILDGTMVQAESRATQNVVAAMRQRAARPLEGGTQHASAIQRRSDPSKLSDKDMDEIDKIVEAGGRVGF